MQKLILTCLFVLAAFFGYSQTAESDDKYPQTVVIRMIEMSNNGSISALESKLITISPENTVEKKKLNDINYINAGSTAIEDNALTLKIELQKWHNLGFTVKSSNVANPTHYFIETTYILQKNQSQKHQC